MSTGNRSTNWLGIIALALVCGLLGTLGGAFAGGVAGFVVGRQTARSELTHAGASTAPQREYNVQPQPLIPPEGWDFQWPEQVPTPSGDVYAQIEMVVAGSPAEQAGLQVGDRIVAVDGEALSIRRDLATIIGDHSAGDRVALAVERGGGQQEVDVTLGENPDQAGQAYLGITYHLAVDAPSRYPSS